MNAEMGLPQGSILSPVLFNVYLEEALKSSSKLEEVRKRGDLLAFADDGIDYFLVSIERADAISHGPYAIAIALYRMELRNGADEQEAAIGDAIQGLLELRLHAGQFQPRVSPGKAGLF